MDIIFSVIADVVLGLLRFLIEIPLVWIGELTLFLFSFGRHKPRWDMYSRDGGGRFAFFSEMSLWVGIIAVCGIGGTIKMLLFSEN